MGFLGFIISVLFRLLFYVIIVSNFVNYLIGNVMWKYLVYYLVDIYMVL